MYRDSTAEKIKEIQFQLATGKSRPEIAKKMGYKDVTGLYHFAARHKLKWNKEKSNYDATGNDGKPIEAVKPPVDTPTGKAASVITMFERGMDGREIAKKLKYKSYQAMADDMKTKGYVWSEHKKNYVKKGQEIAAEPEKAAKETKQQIAKQQPKTENEDSRQASGKYTEILDMLLEKRDRLIEVLNSEPKVIPRYILAGTVTAKTIGIVDVLDKLVKEFCDEKNLKQKELIEIALIEFLRKYGYRDEVKAHLKV